MYRQLTAWGATRTLYYKELMKETDINLGLNVVIEWLAFLLRIREVPGSNLGPETGYPD
jgi:hypothetical protein